jgi:glycosyltransferase involved in cell wall biosynthesis
MGKRALKVLFIVPYPLEGASNRFRVHQYLPFLRERGLFCRVRPFYSDKLWRILYQPGHWWGKLVHGLFCGLNRLLDLPRALAYDVVFIHREAFPLGPAWFERTLARLGRPYVYDFDDAIFLPNVAGPNRPLQRLKYPRKVNSIVRGSRVTLAGNSYLAEFARRSGATRVEVLPTVVDTARFFPRGADSPRSRVVIGWIGSPTTIRFVEQMRPVIEAVLERCRDRAEFRIVGGRLEGALPPGVTCTGWSLETELEELRSFDIGIMPMPDDEWTRGKCAFKAIEYLALGIPAVCSPVGMNLELIEEWVNGFLPADTQAWVEVLCRLVDDPALRERLGTEGRKRVEADYSLSVAAPRLLTAILEAVGKRAA